MKNKCLCRSNNELEHAPWCSPKALEWGRPPLTLDKIGKFVVDKNSDKVFDMRGWGILTGKGQAALGLPDEVADLLQEECAENLVRAVNSHEVLLEQIQWMRVWLDKMSRGMSKELNLEGNAKEALRQLDAKLMSVDIVLPAVNE